MKSAHLDRDVSGRRPHLHLRPTTRLGRWSVGLVGLFFAALIVMVRVVASGEEGGETFFDNWWISGPAFTTFGGAVGAFVTWFVLGEVLAPH